VKYVSMVSKPEWKSWCWARFWDMDPGTRLSHSGKRNVSSCNTS
jgi:hypothetical protein